MKSTISCLTPEPDVNRNLFYGKAIVENFDNNKILYSYGTRILTINSKGQLLKAGPAGLLQPLNISILFFMLITRKLLVKKNGKHFPLVAFLTFEI